METPTRILNRKMLAATRCLRVFCRVGAGRLFFSAPSSVLISPARPAPYTTHVLPKSHLPAYLAPKIRNRKRASERAIEQERASDRAGSGRAEEGGEGGACLPERPARPIQPPPPGAAAPHPHPPNTLTPAFPCKLYALQYSGYSESHRSETL